MENLGLFRVRLSSQIEYFVKNSIRDRFAEMARMTKERKDIPVAQCDANHAF